MMWQVIGEYSNVVYIEAASKAETNQLLLERFPWEKIDRNIFPEPVRFIFKKRSGH